MNFLNGKKTYISAAAIVVFSGLFLSGKIDKTKYETMTSIFLGAGIASIRSSLKK